MRLALTSAHFALSALTLTKPICMRAKVFRLFMATVAGITRVRSVKWLPSLRTKAQEISISFTAKSLPLRSVKLTRAFDPSPPRRQDCEEILSRSRDAIPAGAVPAKGLVSAGIAGAAWVAVAVITGLSKELFCSDKVAGARGEG